MYWNEIHSRWIATKSADNATKICLRPATLSIIVLGERSKGYIPATHQETNCRLVSYENEISRPNATARLRSRLSWKWFWSPSRSQKSARADGRNIFRYLLIFPCLPRIILLPLGFSFSLSLFLLSFFFFLFTRTPSHFQSFVHFVRVCATTSKKISLTFSRIAGSSLEYRMSNMRLRWKKKATIWIHFPTDGTDSVVNRWFEGKYPSDNIKLFFC